MNPGMNRYKTGGWFNDRHRHYLAAKYRFAGGKKHSYMAMQSQPMIGPIGVESQGGSGGALLGNWFEKGVDLLPKSFNVGERFTARVEGLPVPPEYIRGGRADYRSDEEFDAEQLRRGIMHEMEHTENPDIAKEIAKDHLAEDPKYYDNLSHMEDKVKRRKFVEQLMKERGMK